MLPNFIIFGTRKAGTSSLYNYLSQHPQIFMPTLKGSRYFLFDHRRPSGGKNIPIKTLAEYESLFDGARAKGAIAIGEASPSYINNNEVAIRIKAIIPDVKLIASLRNPVDRTYSHYLMSIRQLHPRDRPSLTMKNVHEWSSAGLYFDLLSEYYKVFPSRQIKILIFEKWVKDISTTLRDLYRFLGVNDDFSLDLTTQYNRGGVPRYEFIYSVLKHRSFYIKLKPYIPSIIKRIINNARNFNMGSAKPMDTEVREYLQNYFKNDQERLAELIGQDLSIWQGR